MEDNTASLVDYKLPAKELRKLAETHVYSNLDCKLLIGAIASANAFFN